MSPNSNGMKFDDGKLSYSLLDRAALAWTVAVFTYGSIKYDRFNWRKVENAEERYYDAFFRHVEAWRGGEDYDPETTLPHLAHAACCALMLLGLKHAGTADLPSRLANALKAAREIRARREARPADPSAASPPAA